MLNKAKTVTAILLIVSFILIPLGSASFAAVEEANDTTSGGMIVDILVVRPLGIVSIVAGSVAYAISYPFSSAGGNADEAVQKLVKDPVDYTFDRPLGDF